METALGPSSSPYAIFFDTCRRKRNTVDYDIAGIATRTEVEQLIRETEAFLVMLEGWIGQHYPAFS